MAADPATPSNTVELIRQAPAIIAAIFSGIAMLVGMKNRKQVKTIDQKADQIGAMVDGHASAQAASIKALHEEVVRTQEKRVEDVKQIASTVSAAAPDPKTPQPVVIVDRRKDNPA